MSTSRTLNPTDKVLAKIAGLILQRMEELKGEQWQKPWFSTSYQGHPQNITGRAYQGMNELILDFVTTTKNHELPIFLTFNQATKEGVRINKGASSIPVLYYERSYKDEAGHTVHIPDEKLKELSEEERSRLTSQVVLRKFDVFNIADTNFKEVKPELYEKFKRQYTVSSIKDEQGMYSSKELDRMFAKQEWLCPIDIKQSTGAFYARSSDSITLPLKAQFKTSSTAEGIYRDGMEFYSTAIHEMAHSTGCPNRLDRTKGKHFGDHAYAKEELVAELTAALVGRSLGFDKLVTDNSAKYLNSWVGALKSEPRFILSMLSEVSKATAMIMTEVEKQTQSIKKEKASFVNSEVAVGQITLKQSGERLTYNTKEDYLKAIKEELYINPSGFTYKTLTQDAATRKGVDDLIYDLYGSENPKSIREYEFQQKVSNAAIIKMRNGDFAVRGKVDGVDTGLISVDRQEAVKYFHMKNNSQKDSFLQELVQSAAQKHSRTQEVVQSIKHTI